jgi:protein gp37
VTSIQWTDETWNPVTGCSRVSPGCANCYIERTPPFRMAGRRFEIVGQESTTGVTLHPDRLEKPLHWRKPRRVFVCSLADLFHDDVPDEYLHDVFDTMSRATEHTFQVLTKRPERMRAFIEALPLGEHGPLGFMSRLTYRARKLGIAGALPNVWLGVSIENARYTWRADVLREIPAAVRFISAEPLLGSLFDDTQGQIERKREAEHDGRGGIRRAAGIVRGRSALNLTGIDWVIIGGESGPGARPFHLEHAREIIRAADQENYHRSVGGEADPPLAVFVKQLGASPLATWEVDGHPCSCRQFGIRDRKGGDIDEWPGDLQIREFPQMAVAV